MPTPKTVLVACDKFKGSLTGREVNQTIGQAATALGYQAKAYPVADGGDGTLDALETMGFQPTPVKVSGPTGQQVVTRYVVRQGVAVVELADACGLLHLPGGVLEPLQSSSRGLGEALKVALGDPAVTQAVVGVGGSASSDGGAGLLFGLGAVLWDAAGNVMVPNAANLGQIVRLDLEPVRSLVAGRRIILATDVTNPLLGDHGAVAVFGPQKGLTGSAACAVEAGLSHWAGVLGRACGVDLSAAPGAGSAGGVGFAALSALGAEMRRGVDLILELGGFGDALATANLVVTGEGSLDEQSLMGKAVAGVCGAAKATPVIALCGRSTLTSAQANSLGLAGVYALSELEPDLDQSMRRAGPLLRDLASRAIAKHLPPALPN